MSNATSSNAPPQGVAMLIALLKVATRIGTPMRDAVADPEGLSVTELRIILALGGEGALAGHELADLMAMQPMNVSRALVTLVKMGLVEPVEDESNRRRKPHQLSAAGHAKFASMQPEMAAVAEFLFGGLKESERKQAFALLDRLDARLAQWQPVEPLEHVKRP